MESHKSTHATDMGRGDIVRPIVFIARIIYFFFGIIVAFIALRIVLLLLVANRENGFVDFVYNVSGTFVTPFFGVFNYKPSYGASVFEVSSFVAIIAYALLAWAIVTLMTIGLRHPEA